MGWSKNASEFVPWPAQFAELYRREGYWRGERLGDLLRNWAKIDPTRTAIVAGEHRLTYGELDQRADRLAAGLFQSGLRPGHRVVVQLPNIPEFALLSIALFRIGAVPVYALPSHRSFEILHLCEFSAAIAYFIPDFYRGFDYLQLAQEVCARAASVEQILVVGRCGPFRALDTVDAAPMDLTGPSPGDPAFLLLSGGTGGTPKLIPRTHDDYSYQLRATARELRFDQNSVYLAALPVAHNAALGTPGLLGALLVGGKVLLASSPSPSDVFPLIERERVTLTTLITPLAQLWIEAAEMFGVKHPFPVLQLGGARLEPDVGRKILEVLRSPLTHWFGMAEGLLNFTRLDDPEEIVIHTQGRALSPADELLIVDENECPVPQGEVGQLLTRGPYTLRGYFNAKDYNATAFSPDGYLRTGDLARIRHDGNLVIQGRIKNVINRGGEKISVEELETHLLRHPKIRKVAVVGVPDPMLGERTYAFVVSADGGISLADVKRFLCGCGIADYKAPDYLEIVASLPETGIGKINRRAMRQMVRDRY